MQLIRAVSMWARWLLVGAVSSTMVDSGFVVRHLLPDGSEVRGSLAALWDSRFEWCPPVRRVTARKGQRHFAGMWWSSTIGSHVGFESWLERDHLMLLDFDRDVIAVASQPFWLCWSGDDGDRRHAPDYFVRLADGSAVVVDVRPDERIAAGDASAFATTGRACAEVGWAYRRVGAVDPVFAGNVRWLSGYRHPRCLREETAAALLAVFGVPRRLVEGVAMVGDPIAVRPVLFHLLWSGVLVTDLRSQLLDDAAVVTASGLGR